MCVIDLKKIEEIELKYLKKYYYFLKFAEDEMFFGFQTKEKIKDDWYDNYKSGISDFAVGAERIVYALLNGKGIGQPNSAPVGADLFFEVEDAYIHIDLKTVGASLDRSRNNIGDYINDIFVGENQNSYKGNIVVNKGRENEFTREYKPNLPTYYSEKDKKKVCLSYFITILYDKDDLNILVMCIICMPNGELEPHYKERVLKAGKNPGKTRFRFSEVENFELLEESDEKRVKVIYFDKNMNEHYRNKLTFFENLFDKYNH